LLDRVNGV